MYQLGKILLFLLLEVRIGWGLLDAVFVLVNVLYTHLVVKFLDEIGLEPRPLWHRCSIFSTNGEFCTVHVQNVGLGRDYANPRAFGWSYASGEPLFQFPILLLFKILKIL